jgi:hypothetical protein
MKATEKMVSRIPALTWRARGANTIILDDLNNNLSFMNGAQKKVGNFLNLFSPPPDLPHRGGGGFSSLPWREGLREGEKKAFSELQIIDPLCFKKGFGCWHAL